jgi:hypothetical protein
MVNFEKLIICFVTFAKLVKALYFLVESTNKCFTIEQPRDTPIVFSYEILDKDHHIDFSLHYGPSALRELLISNKLLSETIGHVDFTTDNDGYYSVCLKQAASYENLPSRIKFSIKYGYDSEHYEKLLSEHNFDYVNLEVHKLNDMMTMTLNEADYQKHKEVEYHIQTEKMDSAVSYSHAFRFRHTEYEGI